ncbi:hypothetical protein PV08_05116 [Exophiala spinifera]|uniref:ABM domain-containing protein n=1 Tax=Exophiala spinifera TaxID=91928 RepID=A0A0D1YRQ5_9EURO|nr:uncharacterized protein PV08_05116 [Exophiala spinifera]KIW17921.1 hypothetical protein PV08_05116 [Exophiala spinifera]
MPIPVLVTVYPESDKVLRVEELVKWVTEEVRKNEPAVSDYRSYKGRGDVPEHTVFMIFFHIENEEELHKRKSLSHHQHIAKVTNEEQLMRRPLKYTVLNSLTEWSR